MSLAICSKPPFFVLPPETKEESVLSFSLFPALFTTSKEGPTEDEDTVVWIGERRSRLLSKPAKALKKKLEGLNLVSLKEFIKPYLQHPKRDICLSVIASLLPYEVLKNLLEFDQTEFEERLSLMLQMAPCEARSDQVKKEINLGISFLSNTLNKIIHLYRINFGISKLAQDPTTRWAAGQVLSSYYAFFAIPFVLCSWFISVGASVIQALSMTGLAIAGAITTARLFENYRPLPHHLISCENLTAYTEETMPVFCREKEIQSILQLLASKNRPLLVGKSGVGKTQLVKTVAKRIKEGNCPPSLQGKRLFSINGGDLIARPSFGGPTVIDKIIEEIRGHEEEVILFIDEVHAVAENTRMVNKLKTLIDEKLPYCIVATTEQEHQNIKNKHFAFLRRFNKVSIEELSSEQLKELAKGAAQIIAPEVLILEEAFNQLIIDLEYPSSIIAEQKELKESSSSIPQQSTNTSKVDRLLKALRLALHQSSELKEPVSLKEKRNEYHIALKEYQAKNGRGLFHPDPSLMQFKKEVEKEEIKWRSIQEKRALLKEMILYQKEVKKNLFEEIKNDKNTHQLLFFELLVDALEEKILTIKQENGLVISQIPLEN